MFAEIIVDVANSNVDRVFVYKIPEFLSAKIGDLVSVPFGNRTINGYILNLIEKTSYDESKIKEVLSIKKTSKILPEMIELCNFMVEKYNIKKVDALRLFLINELRNEKVNDKVLIYCKLNINFDFQEYLSKLPNRSIKQKQLIEYLQNKTELKSEIIKKFGDSAFQSLFKVNAITLFSQKENRTPIAMSTQKKNISLNLDQQNAVNRISSFERKTFLLFGVTGSGKTEVYLTCIENVLKKNKTAILLVPEISLTPQVFGQLKARFGDNVAVIHSGLSSGERFDEWNRIQSGEAKVVVGARSAIYAPLQNVGIIIIDEEHESSYNSETNPRYKTIDIALFRAKFNNCPLVLGSATPSIETFNESVKGNYELLELPHRVHETNMPTIQIVDMMSELRFGNDSIFSNQLLGDLQNCFNNGKQALLFLNRRGYTSFMRCIECGYVAKCTDCDAPLVYHQIDNQLKCHFCGKRYKPLTICPNCKSQHIRQGAVGTQKVVDEIQKIFPNIPVFRMDNDTTRTKNAHQKILEEFSKHKPAILVGTQMIAKGHDFSDVDVVGVIDADQTLYQSDYKSAERTFQLITQVSGRAGRKNGGGKIILQTYSPKHYVYRFVANYDYKGFFENEINVRETTNFPPFSTIVRILISNEDDNKALNKAKNIFNSLKPIKEKFIDDIIYFDAMKSPHTKLKNKFRYQILLRFTKSREYDIMKDIYSAVNQHQDGKSLIFVEVNPSSLA